MSHMQQLIYVVCECSLFDSESGQGGSQTEDRYIGAFCCERDCGPGLTEKQRQKPRVRALRFFFLFNILK